MNFDDIANWRMGFLERQQNLNQQVAQQNVNQQGVAINSAAALDKVKMGLLPAESGANVAETLARAAQARMQTSLAPALAAAGIYQQTGAGDLARAETYTTAQPNTAPPTYSGMDSVMRYMPSFDTSSSTKPKRPAGTMQVYRGMSSSYDPIPFGGGL